MASTVAEPADYHFLKWVWEHFEDFTKCEGGIVSEEYTRDTGRPSPYVSEEEEMLLDLTNKYQESLDKKEMPELVKYIAHETDEISPNEDVQEDIRNCISDYYGYAYSLIMSKKNGERYMAREKDHDWEKRVEWCVMWWYNLDEDDEEETLEIGTTCPKVIQRLRETHLQLCAIEPAKKYKIVSDGEGYYYEGGVVLDTNEWDEARVIELLEERFVIGVFAYNTQEEAEEAQNNRCVEKPWTLLGS